MIIGDSPVGESLYEVTSHAKEVFGNEVLNYQIEFKAKTISTYQSIAFYLIGKTINSEPELLSITVVNQQHQNEVIRSFFKFDISNYKKLFIVALDSQTNQVINDISYSDLMIRMTS